MYGKLCILGDDSRVEERVCETVGPKTCRRFYELFGNTVASGRNEDVPVSATQAARVPEIIEAVRESAKTGKEITPRTRGD